MQMINFILLGFQSSAGWIMWIILICMMAGIGLAVERFYYLYIKSDMGNKTFMQQISKYFMSGDFERALKYSSTIKTPLAKAVVAILQNRTKGAKAVKKSVDEVFLTEGPRVKRNIHFLNILANLSTLVGLTGTIFGTMEAFEALANAPAAQRSQQLAAGISIVLSATLFGLLSAVLCIFFYGTLSGKSDQIVEDLDEKSTKLANAIEQ